MGEGDLLFLLSVGYRETGRERDKRGGDSAGSVFPPYSSSSPKQVPTRSSLICEHGEGKNEDNETSFSQSWMLSSSSIKKSGR